MARRSKKSDGTLVVAALVLAPIIWLHDKIGAGGIILLVVVIVALIVVSSRSKKKQRARTAKPRQTSRNATITIPAGRVDDILGALDRMDMTDYLGQAANAGGKAKAASDAGDFDGAWRLYHEQKALYLKHANRSEFTPVQAIALEGSVNRNLANLLRIEGRHLEALVHFLYYFATSPRRTKTDEKQIVAYYNRSEIKAVDIDKVRAFAENLGPIPNFRLIQSTCTQWKGAAR